MASSSSAAIQIPQPQELKGLDPHRRSTSGITPPPSAGAAVKHPLLIDRALPRVANLARLLPSGTVLAFQSLSPNFTNHGSCVKSNEYLSGILIALCVASCFFFSFTDCLVGRDRKLYYGIATLRGFHVFNYDGDDEDRADVFDEFGKMRVRWTDCLHAFFSALVFLVVAFSDSEIQRCFSLDGNANVRELLVNLPLGAGFLASVLFVVFPTNRKGIG